MGLTVVGIGGRLDIRPRIAHHLAVRIRGVNAQCVVVRRDDAQGKLVQIKTSQRKKEAPAAHISGAENDGVRKFVLDAEVEVIGFLRALRVQHRVQRCAQVVPQPCRRTDERNNTRWERIGQRVDARHARRWTPFCRAYTLVGAVVHRIAIGVVAGGVPVGHRRESITVQTGAADHLRTRTKVETTAAAHDQMVRRLPRDTEARAEICQVGSKRRAVAAGNVGFGPGKGYAADGIRSIRIKVLQAVMAFRLTAKDVPAKPCGNGESVVGMVRVFNEGRVIGAGFRDEEILGKVIRLTAWRCSHSYKERSEVTAATAIGRRLVGSGDVESVRARRRGRLAYIQEPLHILAAGADLVLAPTLGKGSDHVVVLAGIDERVVVCRAADAASHVAEIHVGKGLVDFIRGSRRGKSESGKIVNCGLAWIATLILVMAREGVPQLQHRGGADGVVVPNNEIAAVGNVLRVVQIPWVIESVDARSEQPVEGEARKEALLFARVIVHANVELLRGCGVQARKIKVVSGRSSVRGSIARRSVGIIALGKLGEKLQRDGIRVGNLVAGKRLPRPVWIIELGRVIDRKVVGRKVAGPFRGGGNGKGV